MITDIIIFILIALLGVGMPYFFGAQIPDKHKTMLNRLWFFHLLISLYYCFFILGDAIGYWRVAKTMNYEQFLLNLYQAKGTNFIYSLNYFPAKVLNLSYLSGTLIYSLIGFTGILFFYLMALKIIPYNSKFKGYKLFPLVLFMPNLHFWSSAVGKDTILFFCIGLFIYALLNLARRWPLLLLSVFLAYLVRPHIVLFLTISFGLAYLVDGKLSGARRIVLALILLGVGLAILPTVMEYAKIEEASIDSFSNFSENKAQLLSRKHSGSAIELSSYPFLLKIFTFLYRPFFFDIRGIPAVIASLENLGLLLLSIAAFRHKPIATFKAAPFIIKGMLFFLVIGTLAFSESLGNVGIMIRMRNMFLPGMLLYILWSFSYRGAYMMRKKKKMKIRQEEALTEILP